MHLRKLKHQEMKMLLADFRFENFPGAVITQTKGRSSWKINGFITTKIF